MLQTQRKKHHKTPTSMHLSPHKLSVACHPCVPNTGDASHTRHYSQTTMSRLEAFEARCGST